MSISLRPATLDDLPTLTDIDMVANQTHPFLAKLGSPESARTFMLDMTTYYFHGAKYGKVVAVDDKTGELVGHVIWTEAGDRGPEWNPETKGADLTFAYYWDTVTGPNKEKLGTKGLFEIERLAVSPAHQRRGIGEMLVRRCLESVDRNQELYVQASPQGRGLYEKCGFEVFAENVFELGEGQAPYVNYMMLKNRKKAAS